MGINKELCCRVLDVIVENMKWWENAFDEKYIKTYARRLPRAKTIEEVRFLIKALKLVRRADILDVACGYGRHALELARRGYQVTGVDQSRHFISLAKRAAKHSHLKATFQRMDMRRLAFNQEFDVAVNLFTSFGYFNSKRDDLAALKSIQRALKPGGRLLIDVANRVKKVRILKKEGIIDKKRNMLLKNSTGSLSGGAVLHIRETFHQKTSLWRIYFRWTEGRKKTMSYYVSVRLYTAVQLKYLLHQAGFDVVRAFGDFHGHPFQSHESPRLIILAQRD